MSSGRIADAIPSDQVLGAAERDAVLEIAVLAISADRAIDEAELVALRQVAGKLGGTGAAAADLDEMVARALADRDQAEARLRDLALRFTTEAARVVAYKVALGLTMADRDDADEEFEFDLQLIDALELPQALADACAAEVTRLLGR